MYDEKTIKIKDLTITDPYNVSIIKGVKVTHLKIYSYWLDNTTDLEIAGTVGNCFGGLYRLEPIISFEDMKK